jgi:hypothetical protein
MPPIVIPPLVKLALGALGVSAVVFWVVKEVRRVNEELDRAKTAVARIPERKSWPTLKRDPLTGEYRPY